MATKDTSQIAEMNAQRKAVIDELLTLTVPPKALSEEDVLARTEAVEEVLSTVAFKPWQKGFSDSDISFHISNMRGRIEYNKGKIAELKKADEDLIKSVGFKLHGLSSQERERHPVMRDHRTILNQVHSREAFIGRAVAVIEVLQTELDNRTEKVEEQKAEIARRHEEWKAKHAEILKERDRCSTRRKKLAKKVSPKTARSEMTLKGFGELLTLNRRKGVFATEVKLKKAEAVERLGGVDQLAGAFEEAKTKGTDVLHVFEDGRQIVMKKAGAVTRYFERA